jgi:hypothetical protein
VSTLIATTFEIRTPGGELIGDARNAEAAEMARRILAAEFAAVLLVYAPGDEIRTAPDPEVDHVTTVERVERHGKAHLFTASCSCGWSTSCTTSAKHEAQGWADAHVRLTTTTEV